MTPDRRLDQLEPLMADSLQKTDRLIEGQGQLTEIATRADQNADTAARGVANLTLQTQQSFIEVRRDITLVDGKLTQVDGKLAQVDAKVNQIAEDQAELRQEMQKNITQVDEKVDSLRTEMNQRFDQLITLIQERLS